MSSGTLSGRERDVARCAATGATTRQIADELFISARTVESHLASIYRKLGVANRAGLVARLAADDLVAAGDFAGLARSAGIGRVYTCESRAEWEAVASEALGGTGPVFVWLKVRGERGKATPTAPRPMSEQIERLRRDLAADQRR